MAERRKQPRDNMYTDIVQAEITEEDGTPRRLTEYEAVEFGVDALRGRHRDGGPSPELGGQGPGRAPRPAHGAGRRPIADRQRDRGAPAVRGTVTGELPPAHSEVELHGVTIPKDSKVILLTGSAGRDERKYPDPDRFDIRRKVDLHMTFGYGIHFCLGAALTRTEGRIGLQEALKRWPKWEIDYPKAVPLYTSTVRGYLERPILV